MLFIILFILFLFFVFVGFLLLLFVKRLRSNNTRLLPEVEQSSDSGHGQVPGSRACPSQGWSILVLFLQVHRERFPLFTIFNTVNSSFRVKIQVRFEKKLKKQRKLFLFLIQLKRKTRDKAMTFIIPTSWKSRLKKKPSKNKTFN